MFLRQSGESPAAGDFIPPAKVVALLEVSGLVGVQAGDVGFGSSQVLPPCRADQNGAAWLACLGLAQQRVVTRQARQDEFSLREFVTSVDN
ncbi:hypothetical protein DSECCO2_569730 [anaerobic digester metagenome]